MYKRNGADVYMSCTNGIDDETDVFFCSKRGPEEGEDQGRSDGEREPHGPSFGPK